MNKKILSIFMVMMFLTAGLYAQKQVSTAEFITSKANSKEAVDKVNAKERKAAPNNYTTQGINVSWTSNSKSKAAYVYTPANSPAQDAYNGNTYGDLGWTDITVAETGTLSNVEIEYTWNTDTYASEGSFHLSDPTGTYSVTIGSGETDGTYTKALNDFSGADLNGTWKLWIQDSWADGGHQATDITVTFNTQVADDASITAITEPAGGFLPGTTDLFVDLTNYGTNTLSTCDILYDVYDVTNATYVAQNQTYSWTGSLTTGISENVNISSFTADETTTYSITVSTDLTGDENPGNDEFTTNVTSTMIYPVPYMQDFEAGYPAPDWTEAQGLLADPTTLTGTSSGWEEDGFANGGPTGSAKINVWSTTKDEWMFTPYIDLESKDCILEFDLALTPWNESTVGTPGDDDVFAVVISTDNGETWSSANSLLTYTSTHTFSLDEHVTIDLTGYSGVVKLGFYAESQTNNQDNDLFIDNVQITEIVNNDLTVSEVTPTGSYYLYSWYDGMPTATIYNNGVAAQSAYDVVFSFTEAETGTEVFNETVSVSDNIDPAGTYTVTATSNFAPTAGTYSVTATVNLTGDENPANDMLADETLMSMWGQSADIPSEGATYLGSSVLYSGSHGMLLYSFGGNTNSGNNNEAVVLDLMTETWTPTTNLPSGSVVGAATQLNDDEIFIHAGSVGGAASDVCYIYDIATETYTTTASLPTALSWTSATTVNGYVYLGGGIDGASAQQVTTYRYDPAGDAWTTVTGDIPKPVFGGSLINADDQLVYVWGAQDGALSGEVYVGEIDETNPDIVTWTTTATACPDFGTYKMTAAPISDNAFIVTSGDYDGAWNARPNSYIYNLITDTWTQIEDKPTPVLGYAGGSVIIDNDAYYVTSAGLSGGSNTISEYYPVFDINPIAETLAPTMDEIDVALDAPVSVTFDVTVTEIYTPTITISDGVDNFAVSYTLTDNLLEISHDAFDYETTYSVTISEGAFMKEATGGVNEEVVWSFTTMAEPIATYTVTFGVEAGDGTISATDDGMPINSGDIVEEASEVVFTAVPDADWEVAEWYVDGSAIGSTDLTYTIASLNASVDVAVEFTFAGTTGELDGSINIYPNPSNGVFNVNATENVTLKVLDITGKVLQAENINGSKQITINTAGIYFFKFSNENGTSTQRVIVQ